MSKSKSVRQIAFIVAPAFALLLAIVFTTQSSTGFFQAAGFFKQCKAPHRAGGFVRDTVTLARMSAIATWTREVSKYGDDYNFWTNASRKILRCRKINGTRLINCIAWAAPCRNSVTQTASLQIAGN